MIGIDPSLAATGVACPNGELLVIGGAAKLGDRRLRMIYEVVAEVATLQRARLAVIEDLPKQALGAGLTGRVQGVVRLALLQAGVPWATVVPATLKKYATGSGRADKAAMRAALREHTGADVRDDNKVDAWWLRHAGLDWLGAPEIELSATQRAALAKVCWPDEYRSRGSSGEVIAADR